MRTQEQAQRAQQAWMANKKVVIVGGGLAGLATAVGLADRGLQVELLEAKQSLGGRAGSYRNAETGELIDHCQHVAMGGCTNFLHLCQRTGCSDLLDRQRKLYFFSADGQRSDFAASSWLPAPLHLMPALMGMKYLSWRDKFGIGRGMMALMRLRIDVSFGYPESQFCNVLTWLQQQKQTAAAIERFWKVVLVSALADSLENISLAAAHSVFTRGFLEHRSAADVLIPKVSLAELYDQRIAGWLRSQGVQIRTAEPVKQIARGDRMQIVVETAQRTVVADAVVLAVTWKQVRGLLADSIATELSEELAYLDEISSSPISSVHLWTDRPLMGLPHAVLIERLSQWIFARQQTGAGNEHGYQVVISGTHALSGQPKEQVINEVWRDLQAVFPAAREAQLLRARLITQRDAVFREPRDQNARLVFSQAIDMRPHLERAATSPLFFAGDWLNDGWYATMEGAVRSGNAAAERVLQQLRFEPIPRILQPDLPRGWLASLLIRS